MQILHKNKSKPKLKLLKMQLVLPLTGVLGGQAEGPTALMRALATQATPETQLDRFSSRQRVPLAWAFARRVFFFTRRTATIS